MYLYLGKWEKLVDQNWKEVPPIDLLKITKLEGQPWLGLYALVGKMTYPYIIICTTCAVCAFQAFTNICTCTKQRRKCFALAII